MSPKWKKEFLPEHCITSVEIFDPVTSTWTYGPELPNALCGAGKGTLCMEYIVIRVHCVWSTLSVLRQHIFIVCEQTTSFYRCNLY